ncbi:ankyrin repeat domain-containing protein [Mucilaginibacter sp.]|uniref:ankyrin repeat domain-containing protein n=2 Tax=Mucilaginibacter sp. TaxID=1882438 RepID=UPI0025E49865|nr:ankyrin repeat domain-containing protein [Mucilaginibacter sp.]
MLTHLLAGNKISKDIIMNISKISDALFLEAIAAVDGGNIPVLKGLITAHPRLISERLNYPSGDYFDNPYLLWFIADNPIRNEKLPANIVEVTALLIAEIKKHAPDTVQKQLDYALGLVTTGRIPRECGVQIQLMDVLIDAGATPGGGSGALANGNIEAAAHLIKRGGKLTLGTAIGLGWSDEVTRLALVAADDEKLAALAMSAFYGKTDMIAYLLSIGVAPNDYPKNGTGFHTHATPLHQAVCSRSLDSVKLLVKAGARLDLTDKAYGGTPLGWAKYMQTEDTDEQHQKEYAVIEAYLSGLN